MSEVTRAHIATTDGASPRSGRVPWVACLVAVVALAGCQEDAGCVDASEREALLDSARRFLADPFASPGSLRFEGSLNGTPLRVDAARLAADDEEPERTLLAGMVRQTAVAVHASGPFLSVEAGEVAYVARDHAPSQDARAFLDTYFGKGIPFATGLSAASFKVHCEALETDQGPAEKVLFVREEGDAKHALEVQRGGSFLAAQQVDAGSDTYVVHRVAEPEVEVDLGLPRLPARIDLVQVDYVEDNNAYAFRWTIGPGSQWVPVSEAAFALVDENGTVVETMPLGNGTHLRHGRHTFDDRDGNGLVSPGDVLSAGAARGYRVTLWDAWADAQFLATR